LPELRKKIMPIIFIVLLLFAGIMALTQETELTVSDLDLEEEFDEEELFDIYADFIIPVRWFRSNAGGMALEEIQSKFIALRGEYALAIDSAQHDELPNYLSEFHNEEYLIEVRMLYKNGIQIRTQWLFKDIEDNTRLNAVLLEPVLTGEPSDTEKNIRGFIEIYDERLNLISEYTYFEDGGINRIDNEFNENMLISSVVLVWVDGEDYRKAYTDSYRYNRSLSLRAVERVFHNDTQGVQGLDPLRITFPRNIMDAAREKIFISERLNLYPEYFGDVFFVSDSRMVFETDDRGRVLSQTLYDDEDNIIWIINNVWRGNRIVTATKTEGDIVLLAEFQYNSAGDKILERNLRNGVLERLVRAEGKNEIEELYLNNVLVLRAVWEEGRKISETRLR